MFREKEICNAIRTAYLYLFPDKKERKRALSRLNMELVAQSVRYRGESVLAYDSRASGDLFCPRRQGCVANMTSNPNRITVAAPGFYPKISFRLVRLFKY